MKKQLIINADDFGISKSVNAAIIDAYRAGSITSTTMMANGAAAEDAAYLAKENPGLAIGLHFNLTHGMPLSPECIGTGLAKKDTGFYNRSKLAIQLLIRRTCGTAIEYELKAQYDRLVELGVAPTHVDGHQHVQAFPVVFDQVAAFCKTQDIPIRVPWVNPKFGESPRRLRHIKIFLLKKMLERSHRKWAGQLRWNDALFSIFDLRKIPEVIDDTCYSKLLIHSGPGIYELMVHPSNTASMAGLTNIGTLSKAEWKYLCTGKLANLAITAGYSLSSYTNVRKATDQKPSR